MTQPSTAPRIDRPEFERLAPEVAAALLALGKAVDNSGLEKSLTELLKLRASQLNACEFCLNFHLNMARKIKLSDEKIDAVEQWRQANVYSARERAALAWTEALTSTSSLASSHGSENSNQLYRDLEAQFTQSEIAHLTASIGGINIWNRIAGALQFTPPALT